MMQNVKIQTIRRAIREQNDDVLQFLYRRAAGASVSPLTIMRLWYGFIGDRYFICTEHGGRSSEGILTATMEQFGLTYEELRTAGQTEVRDDQTPI